MPASSFEEPKLQAILEKIARDEGFRKPKFSIGSGSRPGDNFVGQIYRAIITEEDDSKSLSLIFKAPPLNLMRQKGLSSDELFMTESKGYQLVLPTLTNFMKKHGFIKSSTFPGTVRCLLVDYPDPSKPNDIHVLVIEDKAPEGYRMGNRVKGLDADHIRLALDKLAYWHASSLALHHKEPQTAEMLKNELIVKDLWYHNEKHSLLDDMKVGVLESLKNLKEPYKRGNPVYDRLEKFVENLNEEFVRLSQCPEDLPCIVHGDCSTNNLLFKYNQDGKVEDACLIDLQITRVTSPACELLFFLYLCTTKELRDAHYEDWLRSYHDKVSSILRALDCDPETIYPWQLLQDHLRRYGLFGVLIAMNGLPVFMAESSEINIDVNSADHEGSVFSGCAKVTDPQKLDEIAQRITDIVHDASRLGYF